MLSFPNTLQDFYSGPSIHPVFLCHKSFLDFFPVSTHTHTKYVFLFYYYFPCCCIELYLFKMKNKSTCKCYIFVIYLYVSNPCTLFSIIFRSIRIKCDITSFVLAFLYFPFLLQSGHITICEKVLVCNMHAVNKLKCQFSSDNLHATLPEGSLLKCKKIFAE